MKLIERAILSLLVILFHVNFIRSNSDEDVTPIPDDQQCEVGQLYANDKYCDSYFVCAKDECTNKTVQKTNGCFPYLNFDPNYLVCSANYTCPKKTNPPKCKCANEVLPDEECESSFYVCVPREAVEIFMGVRRSCQQGFIFDEYVQGCVLDSDNTSAPCLPPMKTVQDVRPDCLDGDKLKDKPLNFSSECPYAGIFPDSETSDGYFVCMNDSCGNLVKSYQFCRNGRNFCPKKKYCTDCDFRKLCTNEVSEFVCPEEGVFADPDCVRRYWVCYRTYKITLEPKRIPCDDGLVFDPESLLCVPQAKKCYNCKKRKICFTVNI